MKPFIITMAVTLIICCASCVDQGADIMPESADANIEVRWSNDDFLIFPDSTTLTISGSDVLFDLPASHSMIGITSGSFAAIGTGKVTCECTAGGSGCSPYVTGKQMGCDIADPCTKCTITKSDNVGNQYDEAYILPVADDGDDYMSVNDLDGQRILPSALLDYSPVSNSIDFLIATHEFNTGPERLMFANIYGHAVLIQLKLDPSVELPYLLMSGGGAITCDCEDEDETKDCPYKTKKMGLIQYCDASDCKKCTLSGTIVDGGTEYDFSVNGDGYIEIH